MPEVASIEINPSILTTMLDESGDSWDLIIASGTVVAHNVILINSHASGGATFYADSTCIDGGGNTGWIFLQVPEITTSEPTDVLTTSCTGNGGIVTRANDGLAITRRGFCLTTGSTAPTVDDIVAYEDGSFDVGEYSLSITGLDQNQDYIMRAFIISGGTAYYGNSQSLSTYPIAPTGVAITLTEETAITLDWNLVERANTYTIYWANLPGVTKNSNKMAGIYQPPFMHSSLSGVQNYYYRVSALSRGLESDLSDEVSSTTTAIITYPDFRPQNWLDVEDYVKLLTSQYQLAENFKSWLRHNLEFYTEIMEAANQMNNDFDLDFAAGNQLDIIGDIVGQSRILPFDPSDGSDPNLDDETYRTLLKAKIALNHWDGTLFSIEQKWVNIFPDTRILIVDNQDMTMNVSVLGNISELIQDLIEHDMIIPRPQGVMINYAWSPRSVIYFAFDIDNNEYSGFDKGRWSPTFTEG